MPDLYSNITDVDSATLQTMIAALEVRAADAQQVTMRDRYFSWLGLKWAARVLEVGCGTGAVARHLAERTEVGEIVGLDPSPVFIEKARELSANAINLTFEVGDARSLPFDNASFDAVVFHTCLCHVPGPDKALAEAHRVLGPGSKLAVFDGDYATTTLATGDNDPLQQCADSVVSALVHDRWLVRRLPVMLRTAGFEVDRVDSHGYVQADAPDYMLTLVDRGAENLVSVGRIDTAMADALKREARRRVDSGAFFGFIAFASLTAHKV